MRAALRVGSLAVVPLVAWTATPAFTQTTRPFPPNDPLPNGQRIEAKDGDTVVIRRDARVRIVHRNEGSIRAVYNSTQRWLVLLIDYVDPKTGVPDGSVDATNTFQGLEGVWPLGERWQGNAVIDEYSMLNAPGGSVGITTDGAFIQLLSGSPATNTRWFADERAVTLRYNGGTRANGFPGGPRQDVDEIEARAVADAIRNAENRGAGVSTSPFEGPGGTTFTSRVGMSVTGGAQAPVRVGSRIVEPKKIVDVKPIVPPQVAQGGIRGVVILELTVGADGSVTSARVLRGIPLLDQAALDAVKQWRYEPTLLNGQAVPIIITATVAFP
jgi:protein TonB